MARYASAVFSIVVSLLVVLPLAAWGAAAGFAFRRRNGRAIAASLFLLIGLGTIASLFRPRRWKALAVFAVAFAALLIWWSTIRPPAGGDWAPDVARQTTGTIDGDMLTLSDVRDFDWRTDEDFTERWSKRSYDLSKLKTLDLNQHSTRRCAQVLPETRPA